MYKTAEHWMMAGKARLFNDENMLKQILEAKTPADAKKIGRLIQGFDSLVWDMHKFDLVVKGNEYKFGQNQELKTFLLATNDSVLVEASPVDRIWGIGLAVDSPTIRNPLQWKGGICWVMP